MNILIADSGGTKTDWVFIDSVNPHYFKSGGLHPAFNSTDEISSEIKKSVTIESGKIDQIFFYGAGCHGDLPAEKIKVAITRIFPDCEINVFDDLTGAARAHLQQTDGIIAALGTGSICGRYKNGLITNRSAALGYAIGDEGSAVDLGKSVIRAYFRNELDEETHQAVEKKLGTSDYSYWMNRIYGSDQPNRVLAAVAGELFSGNLTLQLSSILTNCFERFMDTQLTSLTPFPDEQIVFTGTVANAHSKIILLLLKKKDFKKCSVKAGLIKGLARYHKQENTER
ncbi:ATPase [soil metagenome]